MEKTLHDRMACAAHRFAGTDDERMAALALEIRNRLMGNSVDRLYAGEDLCRILIDLNLAESDLDAVAVINSIHETPIAYDPGSGFKQAVKIDPMNPGGSMRYHVYLDPNTEPNV
ncbi:hypothetical protein J4464_05670 [Candidatus Woesearchaeota archaeon]|nr:hypothetical protein [Candidatus Woesearchaeota archaeon]